MEDDLLSLGTRLHFENPPIVEAIIAISVSPMSDSVIERFRDAESEMNKCGYRRPEPVTQHQFEWKLESGASQFSKQESPLGLKYVSGDGLHAVQFLRNAFVFSRLGKYDTWEQFRGEAQRIWPIYARTSGELEPIGIGVRYINKLFIPINAEPEEYVRALAQMPASIAPTITEMFMRIGVPIPNPEGKFLHTQALLPQERAGFATLLLDNDFQFPVQGKLIEEVWKLLELVREIKDRYFIELTTAKMRETFDA